MRQAWATPKAARGLVERDVPQGVGVDAEKVSRLPVILTAGGSGKLVLRGSSEALPRMTA